jgi:hypothetical protein
MALRITSRNRARKVNRPRGGIGISDRDTDGQYLKMLLMEFDIDCHSRVLENEGFFKKLKGSKSLKEQVWDNFDIFDVSTAVAKSLKAGGFSHIDEFFIDKVQIYVQTGKEPGKSIKEAIKLFSAESEVRKRYKHFRYRAVKHNQREDLYCRVDIRRMHPEGRPAVTLKFNGRLPVERYKRIIDNIRRNLKIKNYVTKPDVKV